ncbi:hypothetical protein RhiirC2_707329 [Rhizophagus irregularis]|uniref:Uncharacterized protein n=1 Tax=Rhizophagus irregularis TaxID=588596 RepID=A0A2N1NRK9_9GLOM|nr:hypothetical protein RhiirC2_707329 [Rhizophagus irregularis]
MSLQKLLLKNLKVHPLFFYKLKPSSIPVDRRYYFNPICNGINRNECVYFNSVETRSNHWSPNDVCNFLKKELKEKWTPDLKDIILSQRISGKDLKIFKYRKTRVIEFPDNDDYGEDGNLLETFKKIVFHSDTKIQDFLNLIKYESTWTETEDKAMKEEILLAIMEALNKYESVPIKIYPKNIIKDQLQTPIMGWDKILIVGERMYLVEAEHNITLENINNLSDEIKEFKKLKKNDVSSEYHELLDKLMIEGIICGVNFPKEFRKMAKDRGLYPGGGRYKFGTFQT